MLNLGSLEARTTVLTIPKTRKRTHKRRHGVQNSYQVRIRGLESQKYQKGEPLIVQCSSTIITEYDTDIKNKNVSMSRGTEQLPGKD